MCGINAAYFLNQKKETAAKSDKTLDAVNEDIKKVTVSSNGNGLEDLREKQEVGQEVGEDLVAQGKEAV